MVGLQSVNRYDYAEPGKIVPMRRDGPECAGYKLNIYTLLIKFGQDFFQLAVSDEGIAAHQRDMEGPIFVNKIEDTVDEGVLFEVGKDSKSDAVAAEVGLVVGITAGAAERALARNLNGQQRFSAAENG
jgi:hypothetical protein